MTPRWEGYVYLQMPQSTDVVTCGTFALASRVGGASVGEFAYGSTYRARADAVPLDPINLPIGDCTYETTELACSVRSEMRGPTPGAVWSSGTGGVRRLSNSRCYVSWASVWDQTPEARIEKLGEESVLLVRRFDRTPDVEGTYRTLGQETRPPAVRLSLPHFRPLWRNHEHR